MARLSRSTSKVTRVCAAPSKPNRSLPAGKPRSLETAADGPFEPDLTAATKRVLELLSIPGVSGNEKQVADTVVKMLLAAGCPAGAIKIDSAHTRTPLPGNSGNVIVSLPGTFVGPRRLLMAHMDTVPVCLGAKPVLSGRTIRSADRSTGLGADDRAGVCVVLSTAIEILTRRLPHPPLTFFFAIQEEVGLWGARLVSAAQLGRPKLAFNFDGGNAEKITVGATGGYRIDIEVTGTPSHAGVAPERGVSAIAISSLAIASLVKDGWHGLIQKNGKRGTSNVGVFNSGSATNVVADRASLRAEARSHDPAFRNQIVKAIEKAFASAAKAVRSVDGKSGRVKFEGRLDYEAFQLDDDTPCVLAAEQSVRSIGLVPRKEVSNGGLDANWMSVHGIPTVTLGCGQRNIHTTDEQLDLEAFEAACRVALRLATGTDESKK